MQQVAESIDEKVLRLGPKDRERFEEAYQIAICGASKCMFFTVDYSKLKESIYSSMFEGGN